MKSLKQLYKEHILSGYVCEWELTHLESKVVDLLWEAQFSKRFNTPFPERIPEWEQKWAIKVYNNLAQ